MKFEESLTESYQVVTINYSGSRPSYEIHDKKPKVLVLDDSYDVDGKGESILGVNLNYYNGDIDKLVKEINKSDNDAGFKGFNTKMKIKKFFSKDKQRHMAAHADERIARYQNFIKNFPYMGKFIRRYKKSAIEGKK